MKSNLLWFALSLWFFSSRVHLLFPHSYIHPVQVTRAFIERPFHLLLLQAKHPRILNQCLNGSCTIIITILLPFSELLPVSVCPLWTGFGAPELHKQVKMQTYHAFTHRRNHVLQFVLCSFPITPHVWCISLIAIELWFESFDGIFTAQIFAQVSSNFFLCALHLSTFNHISYFFYPVSQHLQVLLLLLIALCVTSRPCHLPAHPFSRSPMTMLHHSRPTGNHLCC